jgi:pyruvate,water dikinase
LTLEQAARESIGLIGGKARGLARLHATGLPVPATRVLPSSFYEAWRSEGLLALDPEELWAQAAAVLGPRIAVRSSAPDEDDADRSAAGQYESVMNVRSGSGLNRAIERCFRAAEGMRATSYRGESGSARLALVLQSEVVADRAGVAFSVDPVTASRGAVLIEAVFGHGEGLVSGELEPDRYRVDRKTGEVRGRIADKAGAADGRGDHVPLTLERRTARTLRDHEARAIADRVIRAEAAFGNPVDVEFCLARGAPWFVQCRPITGLNRAS